MYRSRFPEKHCRQLLWTCLLSLCLLLSACRMPEAQPSLPEDSSFAVHFLDVGQGDSALVLCDGEAMLIDGGEPDQSSKLYSYLTRQGITRLEYLVATHPHSDHIGGLSGALQVVSVGTALSPVAEYDSRQFASLSNYLSQQGVSFTIPAPGDTFVLGSAEVAVLGPVETQWSDLNDASLVLKVTYGDTSFLFTGDMEEASERAILETGWDLSATVLKVAHHGSSSSSSPGFLQAVAPRYAVIPVGEGNSYDHPSQEVLARLEATGAEIFRTDRQGTILCTSDGKNLTFSTEKEDSASKHDPAATGTAESAGIAYIGNIKSQKFHLPTCANLPSEKNRVILDSYQAAIDAGYSPCGGCLG